jgi:hypothetical protein
MPRQGGVAPMSSDIGRFTKIPASQGRINRSITNKKVEYQLGTRGNRCKFDSSIFYGSRGRPPKTYLWSNAALTHWNHQNRNMELIYYVHTPKQVHELTRDERLRVQVFFNNADLTAPQIALQTNYTERQIRYALAHRFTSQKCKAGRKVLLNTPQRKRLSQ